MTERHGTDGLTQSEQLALLKKWFKWTMWQQGDWCGSIDGADILDKADSMGLIEMVQKTEPCCDHCACAELYGEEAFPVHCFEYTDWVTED